MDGAHAGRSGLQSRPAGASEEGDEVMPRWATAMPGAAAIRDLAAAARAIAAELAALRLHREREEASRAAFHADQRAALDALRRTRDR